MGSQRVVSRRNATAKEKLHLNFFFRTLQDGKVSDGYWVCNGFFSATSYTAKIAVNMTMYYH